MWKHSIDFFQQETIQSNIKREDGTSQYMNKKTTFKSTTLMRILTSNQWGDRIVSLIFNVVSDTRKSIPTNSFL